MDRNDFSRTMTRIDGRLAQLEAVVLIMLVVAMTVVVFLQIFFRYVLGQPLYWSEELARYLFVWLSILGAALGLQKSGHFGLDILFLRLPEKGRRFTKVLIHLLMGVVILFIFIQGVTLVQKTALQDSPAMEIPMSWAYACLPVGAALMAFHLLTIFFKDWNNGKLE
jgi:TRAP-type C4-dicarboxylate transport system permease small subunit